ncbi:MAG: hypothetical protein IJT26_03960 [Bacteroidales bacterium]|nr:hypothetical protein [Bacteroidales bacterium]
MNLPTVIVLLIVAAALAAALWFLHKGGGKCKCAPSAASCSSCAGCPLSARCNRKEHSSE